MRSAADFIAGFDKPKFQMLVVCGKNPALFEKLRAADYPENVSMHFFRYVTFVDKLMDCSELLITKSGGMTVSEALCKGLPMIIYDPIPGQEARNADYLLEHGAALRATGLPNLHFKLKSLIMHRHLLGRMGKAAGRIARPDAASQILQDVLRRIERR